MEKINIIDANGEEFVVEQSDFSLCQQSKQIHDQKFETKPTTYFKDAFKRFCKNKSSVVGAIIIGILLLCAFIVPLVSPYDLKTPHLDEAFLDSKLFNAGTGFWDGTKKITNSIVDYRTGVPSQYKENAIVKYLKTETKYLDIQDVNAHGGIYIFEAVNGRKTENDYTYDYFKHYTAIEFKKGRDDNLVNVKIKLNVFGDKPSDAEFYSDRYEHAEYRIVLQTNKSDTDQFVVIQDWTKEIKDYDIDVSGILSENNIRNCTGYIRFDLKKSTVQDKQAALYVGNVEFTSGNDLADDEFISDLKEISVTDVNAKKMLSPNSLGSWHSTGASSITKTEATYADFIYDPYEDQLGEMTNFKIGQSKMDEYIANGWCSYDYTIGASSFVKLSDKCPVNGVESQEVVKSTDSNGNTKEIVNLNCNVTLYKYLGYKSMPKFIFGTDASGYDIFTRAFSSLRTSLAVAIIVSAVCLIFGLCWGAISGYFGGNVDLFMERFCEILGGMPTIVLLTLAMVKWGNNIGTFAIASCITGWLGTAGTTRTQFYRFKGREYILSSRTLGSSDMRLIFKHILPNALGTIVTSSVLKIPGVIFSEATLAYLGLGLKGVSSFGVMLSDNQSYLGSHPAMILFPAVIISLLMISFNLFGNGLRDALNPSLKGSE